MSRPALTALIRCRDEERGIGRLIDALREQDLKGGIEIVVVDSGSRDRTVEEVRARGVEPLEIPAPSFTYGGALNLAAQRATAALCAAISAHALPPHGGWARRAVDAMEDDRVACAYGERVAPDLSPLGEPLLQDLDHAERHPFYGYSNSAGVFRRDLWERRPFDESLDASEDKEWAWHWLREGMLVRLDPALAVHHSHRDEGPIRTFRRYRDCSRAEAGFRQVGQLRLRGVASEWWDGPHAHRSRVRARLDPRRVAALAGRYAGVRAAPGKRPA